jgi:hypothetical protein
MACDFLRCLFHFLPEEKSRKPAMVAFTGIAVFIARPSVSTVRTSFFCGIPEPEQKLLRESDSSGLISIRYFLIFRNLVYSVRERDGKAAHKKRFFAFVLFVFFACVSLLTSLESFIYRGDTSWQDMK